MSETIYEALDSEAYDSAGEALYDSDAADAEYAGDSASDYAEDSRSDARRRARQRQIMLARQRRAQSAPPAPRPAVPPRGPVVRAIRAEPRATDLETRAMLERLRRRLDEANRAATRNAWAAEASTAASQILDSFDTGLAEHDWARAAIRGAPTLLLTPGKPRRPGLEGILLDPRVAGGALLAAIWAVGRFTNVSKGVDSVSASIVPSATTLNEHDGNSIQVVAVALDRVGAQVPNAAFLFESSDNNTFTVSQTGFTATVTAVKTGTASLKVTSGGKSTTIPIYVAPTP
jgi:hypothetical protein